MAEAKIEFDRDREAYPKGNRATQYDLDIRKAILGYESLHGMTQSLLQTSLSKSARLLIVGSGTGMELVNYSKLNPEWLLTGVNPAVSNSIYFVTEARIIELLEAAGFSQINKFYNAFLFGGWIAQYTRSQCLIAEF